MTNAEIEAFFLRAKQLKVLVVGDIMIDEYLWGNSERISPEAPVQVVDVSRKEVRLGGAGNVVTNLLSLGCKVRVASVIGDDESGKTILELLTSHEIAINAIIVDTTRKTTQKTRVLANNQQMLRVDYESNEEIDEMRTQQLLKVIKPQIPHVQAVLLSDYKKGVLTTQLTKELISMCRELEVPVLVDPKGADYSKYHGATLLTPNRKEAEEITGIPIISDTAANMAGYKLLNDLKLDALVLTRSEDGMSIFMNGKDELHLPIVMREVYDVSGAGDTVLATIGIGIAGGLQLTEAAKIANLAAGIVVGKVGTATATPNEISREIELKTGYNITKILSLEKLEKIILEEKNRGRIVVFTNGCFDLLHVGHIKYLQTTRTLGDILVLGLNSDASVRRLKGNQRPLVSQEERSQILAALDSVDYVCLFDEDTPLELIRSLQPDILVKGGDYKPEEVVGKEVVENYGGRVELINFVDGKSTTEIINKVLENYAIT